MIIKGEVFEIKKIKDSNEITLSDEELNAKYLRGEIRIITEQARYPLDSIPGMLASSKYKLNPEYQRRKRWTVTQRSKLIESFIINVPLPPIFLYEIEFAQYEIMDGLQRLTAIDDFYKGNFALEGLQEWHELNGKKYNELPHKVREGIDRRYLSSIILLNETAKTKAEAEFLKQIVFGRLNSGGDKLSPQEIRNALYGGKFNTLCIQLTQNEHFRKLWNTPQIEIDENGQILNEDALLKSGDFYRKMEDVEVVLRYFAFRHLNKLSSFKSQEKFIDEFLIQANNFSDEVIFELKGIFEKTLYLIFELFGNEAFYMPSGIRVKTTPTKTVCDSLMQSVSKILNKEAQLISKKSLIKEAKFKNKSNLKAKGKGGDIDIFDGSKNNPNNVDARVKYFDDFFESMLNS